MAASFPSAAESRRAAELSYDRAIDELARGAVDEAITGFQEALAADPAFSDAAHGLIHALKDAGRMEEAITTAQSLIAADPDDTLAYTSLSILYQHQGKVPEAEAAALRAKLLGWKQQLRGDGAAEGGD